MTNDVINHPAHYTDGKYEVIDFIKQWKLPYHLGNTVKYICRSGKKDPAKTVEDLEKGRWYLDDFIKDLDEYNVYCRMTAFMLRDIDFESECSIFSPDIKAVDFCEDKKLPDNLFNAICYIAAWCNFLFSREDVRAYLELCKAREMLDVEINRLNDAKKAEIEAEKWEVMS